MRWCSSFTSIPAAAKPFCGKLKQFRNRLDVRVGVNRIDVTQIGRQLRQFSFNIEPSAIPVATTAALGKQVYELGEQSGAIRDNAEAARLGAQAVITSERPFIKVEFDSPPTGEFFRIMATNCGKTPAEIRIHVSERGFFLNDDGPPLPPIYNSEGHTHVYRRITAPGDLPFTVGDPLMISSMRQGGPALMAEVDNGTKFLFYWGRIVYIGALGKERDDFVPYETRWCFQYVPSTFANGRTLIRAGHLGYNEHT
jgi:hypothetical protein